MIRSNKGENDWTLWISHLQTTYIFCCTSSAPPVSLKLQHSWWNSIIEHRRSCLPCTALPYSHTAAYPQGIRHSMCCADSSEWGLFGHNTRSAFRRTPSRKMQPILQRRSHFFEKYGFALWICHSLFTLISKLLSWKWMAYSIDKSIHFSKKMLALLAYVHFLLYLCSG